MSEHGTEILTIYVRKGSEPDRRLISFQIPRTISLEAPEVLAAGFALDGNSATVEVTPNTSIAYSYAANELPQPVIIESIDRRSLTQALHDVEKTLVDWLLSKGPLYIQFA